VHPHKATGPDKIQGRFLKEMALEITPAITYLFNKSLELGRLLTHGTLAAILSNR
jgi:hypothetical protein